MSCVLAGILFLAFVGRSTAQEIDVAVVVSENNHAVNGLTMAELRKIFGGERHSWAVGLPIKLVVRPPASHERLIMLKLLGMNESEYKKYWVSQIFRGEADAEPLTLPSLGMQMEALAVFPGAITFVNAHEVKAGMKVLSIDGHLPNDSGYPLR